MLRVIASFVRARWASHLGTTPFHRISHMPTVEGLLRTEDGIHKRASVCVHRDPLVHKRIKARSLLSLTVICIPLAVPQMLMQHPDSFFQRDCLIFQVTASWLSFSQLRHLLQRLLQLLLFVLQRCLELQPELRQSRCRSLFLNKIDEGQHLEDRELRKQEEDLVPTEKRTAMLQVPTRIRRGYGAPK